MNRRPRVSVVLTSFKRKKLALAAAESIFSQTYPPAQLICIEDGSLELSKEELEALNKRPENTELVFERNSSNRGLAFSRNRGVEFCTSEWIAFCDDDDTWHPNKLQLQFEDLLRLDSMRRHEIDCLICRASLYEGDQVFSIASENHGSLRNSIVESGPQTVSSAFVIRKSVFEAGVRFDETLASSIDHDLWMQLAAKDSKVLNLPIELVSCLSKQNRKTIMVDSTTRLKGVLQFLNKWRGPLTEWSSSELAEKFMSRYLIRVGLKLFSAKLDEGRQDEALKVLQSLKAAGADPHQLRLNVFALRAKRIIKASLPRAFIKKVQRFSAR